MIKVVAFFSNSAPANSIIQLLTMPGVPNEGLGVTPPEQIENGQGMILSISCSDERMLARVEDVWRPQGAEIRRRRT